MQLTEPAEWADLPSLTPPRRAVALAFLISLLVYWAFIPRLLRYSNPPTGDQAYYLMDTISLAEDGDLDVANNFAARDEDKLYSLAPHPPGYVSLAAPYPLNPQLARAAARPYTEQYSYPCPASRCCAERQRAGAVQGGQAAEAGPRPFSDSPSSGRGMTRP